MSRATLRLACLTFAAATAASTGARAGPDLNTWTTIKNERHGFAIAYPTAIFEQKAPSPSEEGRIFVSKDGKAKLLIGAFANDGDQTLDEYRAFLMADEFAGASIDYAPVKQRWFVLSGVRGGEIFYQRVSFTCGGRLINSWAMLYPESERKVYDRVVEAVARTYSPGAGRTGVCD